MDFAIMPITIKRNTASCLAHAQHPVRRGVAVQSPVASGTLDYPLSREMTDIRRPHAFSANSVGVLPVTCRKAWENAGTLA
jgi:hypothetical protein